MARTGVVNIPRDVIDDYYRYTMPVLRIKQEGSGNGKKTVLENIEDIARALNRPLSYPTKYLGFELGALTKIDQTNHKYIINGHRSADELADVLDSFIQRYVLCQKCRNPETVLHIKGETITAQCKACGRASPIDMAHKLSTFILRNPPEKAEVPASASGKREERGGKARQVQKKEEPSGDAEKWSVDTSAAAVEARRRELLGTHDRLSQKDGEEEETQSKPTDGSTALVLEEGKNPIPAIQKYFATSPDPKVCVQVVQNAAGKVRWTDTQTVKAVMASLFDSANIRNDFYKKCELLAPFVQNSKAEKIVLYCLEKMVERNKELVKNLPHVLNGFYSEAILSEDTLIRWFDHLCKIADAKESESKEKRLAISLKGESSPFVEWLKNADSEEEF